MRVMLRFGDNDFSYTFLEVFRLIEKNVTTSRIASWSKEDWSNAVNHLALPIYLVCQNNFPTRAGHQHFASTEECDRFHREYLRTSPEMFFFDREIDQLLNVYGDGNGAWIVYDSYQHDSEYRVYAV